MQMKQRFLCLALLLVNSATLWAQREVSGQVTDGENKSPLQGVNVTVKNSRVGTATDADGKFRLAIPADAKILVFTYSGFESREFDLSNGQTDFSVSLAKNVLALNEVVIAVAYGEQERKKITGAVGKVTGKQLENIPMASVDQM